MKLFSVRYFILGLFTLLATGCTDLDEKILDEQNGENLVYDENNVLSLLNPPYASLRNVINWNVIWGLQEMVTDELAMPTRGTDWYDGGKYQQLYNHTWTADHPTLKSAWEHLTQGLARANTSMYYIGQFTRIEATELYINEARFLRALYMYYIADLFGQVPFREDEDQNYSQKSKVMQRKEAVEFIISEIKEVLPGLKQRSQVTSERVTREAAYALLARIYLNHEVYTGEARWDEAANYCTLLIDAGMQTVTGDYWSMFQWDIADPAPFILTVPMSDQVDMGSGSIWINFTLHYHQIFGNYTSFWNGGCTTPAFIATWDTENDARFSDDRIKSITGFNQGFLKGQQYSGAGEALKDRSGNPLAFVPEFDITNSNETAGVRVVKFAPNPNTKYQTSYAPNDYPLFRIDEFYLVRAEAKLRAGKPAEEALADVNYIRERRSAPGKTLPPLTSVTLDDIQKERGYELYWEGIRRQDLIRFGKFAWGSHLTADADKTVYPIPTSALDVNDNLKQNTGY